MSQGERFRHVLQSNEKKIACSRERIPLIPAESVDPFHIRPTPSFAQVDGGRVHLLNRTLIERNWAPRGGGSSIYLSPPSSKFVGGTGGGGTLGSK
eukprot:3148861-Prymnesium_polylepis.1